MKKTLKINPLKHFNDALAKRKTNLQKAQYGKPTAFQSFVKQYPNSGSDTLSHNAPIFDGSQYARDLAEAQKKTFGNTFVQSANPKDHTTAKGYVDKEGLAEAVAAQKAARIPQQKQGGPIKSKSIEVRKEGWKNDTVPSVKVKQIPSKRTGIYDYKTGKEIVYTTAGPKLAKKHGGATKAKKK